jgi:hypothetical protein
MLRHAFPLTCAFCVGSLTVAAQPNRPVIRAPSNWSPLPQRRETLDPARARVISP